MIRRFIVLLLLPALIICIGTAGYMFIEGWEFLDSLYMTVMTVTTVGFGEVRPLKHNGRIFTIFLMLGGIYTLFYVVGEVIRTMVSGQLQAALGRQAWNAVWRG